MQPTEYSHFPWVKMELFMKQPGYVTVVLSPPFLHLWFDELGETFPFVLFDLKASCPWMRWNQRQRVWAGSTYEFAATLRFCRKHFATNQIVVVWSQGSTGEAPRQLRMF